jgi:hypothetical protein
MPVELTWEFRRRDGYTHNLEVHRTKATVIIDQLFGPRATSHLYHRRWGFSGPIRLSEVVEAHAPEAEYGWEVVNED